MSEDDFVKKCHRLAWNANGKNIRSKRMSSETFDDEWKCSRPINLEYQFEIDNDFKLVIHCGNLECQRKLIEILISDYVIEELKKCKEQDNE